VHSSAAATSGCVSVALVPPTHATVTGTVSGSAFSFNVDVTTPCAGTLEGTGTVNAADTQMQVSFSGTTSCGGAESGTGSLLCNGNGSCPR